MAASLLSGCSLLSPSPTPTVTVTPSAITPVSDDATSPSSTSSAPTTAATPTTSSPAPTNVSTLDGGDGTAMKHVLATAALGAGWSDDDPRDTGGYRMTVCGVDLEPASPVDAAQRRWSRSAAGPFLEEHVRVYSGTTAQDVIARLRKALPPCKAYAQGSQKFAVTPLKVSGADSATAAWRQRALLPLPTPTSTAGTAAPPSSPSTTSAAPTATLVQDVAVTQVGNSVVLLSSYAVDAQPQGDVLPAALRRVRATN